jgi:hypothetical protein
MRPTRRTKITSEPERAGKSSLVRVLLMLNLKGALIECLCSSLFGVGVASPGVISHMQRETQLSNRWRHDQGHHAKWTSVIEDINCEWYYVAGNPWWSTIYLIFWNS